MFRPVINDTAAQAASGQPQTGDLEMSFGGGWGVRGEPLSDVGMEGCSPLGEHTPPWRGQRFKPILMEMPWWGGVFLVP